MASKKAFFEAQIEANKPPPQIKKERTWTPSNNPHPGGIGGHTTSGFSKQTRVKKVMPKPTGAPPAKKSLSDLP